MKKIFIVLLAVMMIFSMLLVGCGGTSDKENNGAPTEVSDRLSASYADMMKNGKFSIHYKTTITADGQSFDADITSVTDGSNVSNIIIMNGITNHTMIIDGTVYSLNDENKTYSKMEIPNMGTDILDAGNMEYAGDGKETINGKKLEYEEYTIDGGSMRYYFDGTKLYGMSQKSEDGEMFMEIIEITDKIPSDALSIPSDYTEDTLC